MSEQQGEQQQGDGKKKVRRKPLWLATPAGTRSVETATGKVEERLYTIRSFEKAADVRKVLEDEEFDVTNIRDVILLRADPLPLKATNQVVIKFGASSDEDEEEPAV